MSKKEEKIIYYEEKINNFLNYKIKKEIRKLREKRLKEKNQGGK